MTIKSVFGFAIGLLALTGCGSGGTGQQGQGGKVPEPAVTPAANASKLAALKAYRTDGTSADNAVKSWWQLLDVLAAARAEECEDDVASPDDIERATVAIIPTVAGNELLTNLSNKRDCSPDVFRREIQEVKQESETRAIVFARVWNVTPPDQGAEPGKFDAEWRADGFKFKYLVEKQNGAWKISQVYAENEYQDDPEKKWSAQYKAPKPEYPSYVGIQ